MSDYKWLSNLRAPFDRTDKAYLERLADYKVGAPQRAVDRDDAYSDDELRDFNIVGIYTTAWALRNTGDEAFTVAAAKKALGADYSPLEGPLAKYLDADLHFRPR
jgi:hypothetical protein